MSVEASPSSDGWTLSPGLARPFAGESSLLYGIAFWLALVQVSIAASQIVLGLLVAAWLYRVWKGELTLVTLPFDRPFALYATLGLLSASFSFDPAASLAASKKLLLLVVPYLLVSSLRRAGSLETLVLVLVAMADASALVGLWQYGFGESGDINHRIHGFLSHYMTYSGLLMSVGVLALAGALFQARHRWFLLASVLVIQLALVLTLTRSAWIGMLAASALLLFLRDRRLLAALPLLAILTALLLPGDVHRRLGSFLTPDTSGWDRLYMLEAGGAIVRNHPWLGVGPEMVPEVYPVYAGPGAPHRDNPHLHNNLMQIAAERGLLSLASWLWFVVLSFLLAVRAFRRASTGRTLALSAGAMGVVLAGFLAGLFEYNFGDSEFQMLYLFAMTIPLILLRSPTRPADGAGTRYQAAAGRPMRDATRPARAERARPEWADPPSLKLRRVRRSSAWFRVGAKADDGSSRGGHRSLLRRRCERAWPSSRPRALHGTEHYSK